MASQQGSHSRSQVPQWTRHLLALATWQPIPYIAGDLGIPEQTIRAWVRR